MTNEKRVCVGAFAGAHGVRGDAKVKTFTEVATQIANYGPVESDDQHRSFTLKVIRSLKPDLLLVRAPEITSREDAQALAGTRLYVNREKLPSLDEEEFYHEDLVGLLVRLEDDTPYGKITAVHNFGAGDILEIREIPDHKGSHLIPFTHEAVPTIAVGKGYIILSTEYLPQQGE